MKLDAKTKKLIEETKYMTIATVDGKGDPWITPVFYTFDAEYNFYWYSQKVTDHSMYIKAHPTVAVSIYDQNMDEDHAGGLYMKGSAAEIDQNDLERVINLYVVRSYPGETNIRNEFVKMTEDFKDEAPLRFYTFAPEKAWILGDSKFWNNKWLDSRQAID